MDIKILENLFLVTIEQGNLWKRQDRIMLLHRRIWMGIPEEGDIPDGQSTSSRQGQPPF